jgi:hypothetical protein
MTTLATVPTDLGAIFCFRYRYRSLSERIYYMVVKVTDRDVLTLVLDSECRLKDKLMMFEIAWITSAALERIA